MPYPMFKLAEFIHVGLFQQQILADNIPRKTQKTTENYEQEPCVSMFLGDFALFHMISHGDTIDIAGSSRDRPVAGKSA